MIKNIQVNHSCLPNCEQRLTKNGGCSLIALRDIHVGEELCFSYVSILGTNDERREALSYNYRFRCCCPRCMGDDCTAFDAEHTCFCGGISLEVDRRKGECVCNPFSIVL
mmetsp:Transcript_55967/g.67462  ORF Transcript_55967/g.67462 Transcript_55967/m.67462 type:complete len:110 (+) Transcript_55967:159-488(+)